MFSQADVKNVFGDTEKVVKNRPIQRWRQGFSLAARAVFITALFAILAFALPLGGIGMAAAQSQGSGQQPTLGTMPQALTQPQDSTEQMVSLRRYVVVRDEVVRLKDLFEGPLANPDKAMFRAPPPGQSVQLDVGYLSQLARQEGLNWRPLSQNDGATISRASNHISIEDLLSPLVAALTPMGLPDLAEINFTPDPPPLSVPADSIPQISISSVRYDRNSGRFYAMATIEAKGITPIQVPLNGVAYETLDIPVAASTTMRDQILTDKDITWQRVRTNTLAAGVATDYDQVYGMQTRRVLRPGEPFRLRDLSRPVLVKKNSLVTMIVSSPLMQLTAQGKALEDGALGDVIRVQNPRSGKTILGTVVENRTVRVESTDSIQ